MGAFVTPDIGHVTDGLANVGMDLAYAAGAAVVLALVIPFVQKYIPQLAGFNAAYLAIGAGALGAFLFWNQPIIRNLSMGAMLYGGAIVTLPMASNLANQIAAKVHGQ